MDNTRKDTREDFSTWNMARWADDDNSNTEILKDITLILDYASRNNIDLRKLAEEQGNDAFTRREGMIFLNAFYDLVDPIAEKPYKNFTLEDLHTRRKGRGKKAPRYITDPGGELSGKKLLPMVHGKATDALSTMAGQKTTLDPYSGSRAVKRRGATLTLRSENGTAPAFFSVGAHKLLSMAMFLFTKSNNANSRDLRNLKVAFALKEYASMCGYDVMKHTTATPEEAEREAQRAREALKKARRKIKTYLDELFFSYISWAEDLGGSSKDFYDVRVISARGIEGGYIKMTLSVELAEYLVQLPLTQYSVALLRLDERNPNAYSLGVKLAEHYSMDGNRMHGTAQTLKVSTMLKAVNLPDIETLRKQHLGWEPRIKKPLETALDALRQCGLLSSWRYSGPREAELTDAEIAALDTFEKWTDALIYFEMVDTADEARLERKAAQAEKKKTTPGRKGTRCRH